MDRVEKHVDGKPGILPLVVSVEDANALGLRPEVGCNGWNGREGGLALGKAGISVVSTTKSPTQLVLTS